METRQPILLCIAGFDPTGGAGLQADVETAAALGVRCVCAQTCNTLQSAAGAHAISATPPATLARQVEYLAADFRITAIKVGLVATAENARVIANAVAGPGYPLVTDPVLRDGAGRTLCDADAARAIRGKLLPLSGCATPNREELMLLAPEAGTPAEAARTLLDEGCGAVLVTSERSDEHTLYHMLHLPGGARRTFSSARLPGEFHGSGCTLSTAIAAQLSLGRPLEEAVRSALAFTARALENAYAPDGGATARKFPKRL